MVEIFPLLKDNNDINSGLSEKFISILSKSTNPHFICIYGDSSLGKSSKLNQVIKGINSDNYFFLEEPFKTKSEICTTQTIGCGIYGPVKVKDLIEKNSIDINTLKEFDKNILDDDLFFVDTEGLKSINQPARTFIISILAILQISSIKISYMPILDKDKLEEIKKISGLSNLLKLIGGLNETIILIRDVSAKKESYTPDQIKNDLVRQQKLFIKAINDFFGNKLNKKEAICEILPNYELAKYIENYALAYKEQMKSLISTILIKIKKNNMDGNTFVEILKLLIDIFKNVEGLNKITDINIAINQIFKEIFERKVIKAYNEIKNKIYDKNIINLENFEREDVQKLLMNFVKIEIKDNLYIFYAHIKNDIYEIINFYELKLYNDLIITIMNIKKEINAKVSFILENYGNDDINNYFSNFSVSEEIEMNEINTLIKKITDKILFHFTKEFKYLTEFKKEIQNRLEKYFAEKINDRIKSMPKSENYLLNKFENIKNKIINPFVNDLLKSSPKDIKKNLDFRILKQKIKLNISNDKIIRLNEDDFQKKLNELYEDMKIRLNERIDSIEKEEIFQENLEAQLKGKTISDGIYSIKSMNLQNKVVYLDNNNNLVIGDFSDENIQKFEIKYNSEHKYYTIQNIENNKYISCNDSIIYLSERDDNNTNQQWHIINNDNDGYKIISEKSKKFIQVEENSNNGLKISCQEKNGTTNQILNFEQKNKTIPHPQPSEPKKIKYFPKPNFHGIFNDPLSIVDALGSVGFPSDESYRLKIGIINNIHEEPFTRAYNTKMLNLMKQGILIIP